MLRVGWLLSFTPDYKILTYMETTGWILFVWAQVMGWSKDQISAYIAHLLRQLRDTKVHSYCTLRCVYGRKAVADRQDLRSISSLTL